MYVSCCCDIWCDIWCDVSIVYKFFICEMISFDHLSLAMDCRLCDTHQDDVPSK